MSRLTVALGLLLLAAVACLAEDKYTDKFDHVNVDAILANNRLLEKYLECLGKDTNDGCTEDGKALKGVLSEALSTDCAKCTDKQKEIVGKVLPFLRKNRSSDWEKLQKKYDPSGTYVVNHPELFA